jgi:serine/threonine protein kinase/Tol biopolymer transport system component
MPLNAGTKLGAYEIVALVGSGGMGEVYRARDTRLKRDVAIKVLPDAFANDSERLARFQREAELLATLNHPHIAQIHGLEDRALVLELVEGPTLAERIAQGPIPLDEALPIARQIAEALEAAHERGVIHRDLKPANIKLTDDGNVKVLDFGLAKALSPAEAGHYSDGSVGGPPNLSVSPTITSPAMTGAAGVILGTAAYMSPEQAKGRPVDKRTDIWAFGCVFFEMLTGQRTFEGDDVSDTLAAVLRAEPEWNRLPSDVLPQVRLLLQRCLEKDRSKRISDISVARFLVTEPIALPTQSRAESVAAARRPLWRRAVPAIASGMIAAVLAAAAVSQWQTPDPRPVTRFTYHLPTDRAFTNTNRPLVAFSGDGTQMAFIANFGLHVRKMSERHATTLTGRDPGALAITTPVFSPDGRWIAFWVGGNVGGGTIKKISTAGGAAVTLCQAVNPVGMSWDGNNILFAQTGRGILRVSAAGGTPEVVVPSSQNELGSPQMLPTGRHILYTVAAGLDWDKGSIMVHELGSSEPKKVVSSGSDARYVPSGHLLYAQQGVLMAAAFDLERLEVRDEAVPVLEGVRRATVVAGSPAAQFTVSNSGSLAYLPGPAKLNVGTFDIALLDRRDSITRLNLPPNPYAFPRFSPDGRHLAVGVESESADIWIYDLSGTSSLRRLTFGGKNRLPTWSGDSRRVAFQSDRDGDHAIFWQPADGSGAAERLTKPEKDQVHWPYDWSPSGETMLFGVQDGNTYSVWTLSRTEKKVQPFGGIRANQALSANFSPDGKWVAYSSNPSGPSVILVQPFPANGSVYQVGTGINPFWSSDGRHLYYSPGPTGFFHEVRVQTNPGFSVSNPVPVPRSRALLRLGFPANYDVAPNNQQFAIVVDTGAVAAGSATIDIVLNWFEELKQRVPATRD